MNQRADRCIKDTSDANRPLLERILQRKRNLGLKPSTLAAWAEAMRAADRWARRDLRDLGADDWSDHVAHLHTIYSPKSVYTKAAFVKATLPELLDLDELPAAMKRALIVREKPRQPEGRVVSDDQFDAVLQAAATIPRRGTRPLDRVQYLAIVWTLRDSGMRAREMLALRVGSVQFDGPVADLVLPPHAEHLKTGPRTVPVARCIPALKAWLAIHPAGGDPEAPLFCRVRDATGMASMRYIFLAELIPELGDLTGIRPDGVRVKGLTCHDFRHTHTTEAARANWNNAKMEDYFGWAPGSKMAAYYPTSHKPT